MSELSSLWGGLNNHLVASFWMSDKNGGAMGDAVVRAPLTEASLEVSLGWQSAFENLSPDRSHPTIMSMLQTGYLSQVVSAMGLTGNQSGLTEKNALHGFGQGVESAVQAFEGRSSMTKLNSTQVFTGMPPVKIQVTALFRAWRDADWEVEAPFNQLMSWALPIELAKDGALMSALNAVGGGKVPDAVKTLTPSLAPVLVGMTYKGRTFAPLVIENIQQPLDSPIDSSGKFMSLRVPMTLATLTAIDRKDWAKAQPM